MFGPLFIVVSALWLLGCAGLLGLYFSPVEPALRVWYSNGLQISSAFVCALLCFRTIFAFEAGDSLRKVWGLLGSGALVWGCGALLYAGYQYLHPDAEPPYPWFYDICYLAMPPLVISGLLMLKRSLQVPAPTWGILTAVWVLVVALSFQIWSSLGNFQDAQDIQTYAAVIGYMMMDPFLIATTVLSASVLGGGLMAMPWWAVLMGLLSIYTGDLGYNFLVANETYLTGMPVDLGWIMGWGFVAAAAMMNYRLMKS